MRVSFIRSIIANKKPDYQIAVIWYDKTDAENVIEDDLSPAEWEQIVELFSHNEWVNQIADEVFSDVVNQVIESRKKDKK